MFKKALSDLKTSAPVRSSDRRKLKQQVIDAFALTPEEGNLLVPDLLVAKFNTHLDEQGNVYLSKEGDPLWFTIGKGSDQLIPSVYTLWKKPSLLPFMSTPPKVIPVLTGGADLMAPGVVQHSSQLVPDQLVAITQYYPNQQLGPPLAVARMAINSDELRKEDVAGKAAFVLHTWKDHLWMMGKNKELAPPDPTPVSTTSDVALVEDESDSDAENEGAKVDKNMKSQGTEPGTWKRTPTEASSVSGEDAAREGASASTTQLSPEDVTTILRSALIHALLNTLSKLPAGTLPMASSQLYTAYILPARPAHKVETSSPVDIKHSSHKTLATFLKACEKEGLVILKQGKGDILLASVPKTHPAFEDHTGYRTVQQEAERQRKRDEKAREDEKTRQAQEREISVIEMWKPHQTTIRLFEENKKDPSAMYALPEIKTILETYIATKQLVNSQDQAYINVAQDNVLLTSLVLNGPNAEFMKRDELLKRLLDKMQAWYGVKVEGRDPALQKGTLSPIKVEVKTRQGRKACTFISGFEPFHLGAEDLSDTLRKLCASATTVSNLEGKSAGQQVMVQGDQRKAVSQLLSEKGVPEKWIKLDGMKKKKK